MTLDAAKRSASRYSFTPRSRSVSPRSSVESGIGKQRYTDIAIVPVIPPRYRWFIAPTPPPKVNCDVAARKIIFLLADGWRGQTPDIGFMADHADEVLIWNLASDPSLETGRGNVASIADVLVDNYRPHISWKLVDADPEAIRTAVGDTCPVFEHTEFINVKQFRKNIGKECWEICLAALHRR